ncbi:hypothetical protein F5148DRAFT_1171336 [Russula earlei]|uniref:Uncharacterized protein n=1 Tax=Russula earlei TaxID=71964 RepID=A0ACC0UIC3_9AGAM|nr:hypothetical protein F5148DRAFT_1171336 [Russula earlei]
MPSFLFLVFSTRLSMHPSFIFVIFGLAVGLTPSLGLPSRVTKVEPKSRKPSEGQVRAEEYLRGFIQSLNERESPKSPGPSPSPSPDPPDRIARAFHPERS